jgi:cyclic pyranopterin phosphate synthase
MSDKKITMIDISLKPEIERIANAEGKIFLKNSTIQAIKNGDIKKGDPLINARYAAVNAVKKTASLIFLAHPIPITNVEVDHHINQNESFILLQVRVRSIGRTGVELEALNGVMIGLLSIWDMVKYLEKDEKGQYRNTIITDVRVTEKIKREI